MDKVSGSFRMRSTYADGRPSIAGAFRFNDETQMSSHTHWNYTISLNINCFGKVEFAFIISWMTENLLVWFYTLRSSCGAHRHVGAIIQKTHICFRLHCMKYRPFDKFSFVMWNTMWFVVEANWMDFKRWHRWEEKPQWDVKGTMRRKGFPLNLLFRKHIAEFHQIYVKHFLTIR